LEKKETLTPALEDITWLTFQKAAQDIINKLCEKNKVPKIPVEFIDELENVRAAAEFAPLEWKIYITKDTFSHALIHEFIHYLLEICSTSSKLDEALTERASMYYEWQMMAKDVKDVKMKKMLENFESDFKEFKK